ncbi:MAG: hypothetical protein OZ919_12200 [Xanthomonadaceae bacterium]|jgi:hypothetical protein|nr:hypothetical protein [Xanthomonadaceae bacterium]
MIGKMEFRVIVSFLLFVQIMWYFFPWDFAYRNGVDEALQWQGAGAFVPEHVAMVAGGVLLVLYMVAYIGVLLFKGWARKFLVLLAVLEGVSALGYGITIQSGYESMLGYFIVLGNGFVIAVSYFSNIREYFEYR